MKSFLISAFLVAMFMHSYAQEDLFGKQEKIPARKGFIIVANGSFDLPAADMAKRFGASYRVGPAIMYKTTSNWVWGAKGDFMSGNVIKEDSLMYNIKDKYGTFLSDDGARSGVVTLERGYLLGLEAGKIINTSKTNADNGILLLTTAGFIQHKIRIYDKDKEIMQLRDEYLKGYDRLTNGFFAEEYIAYNYMAHDGLLNFHIGLDAMFGFTAGRRNWLFDVQRPDLNQRLDILFGIRGGWYLPIFKRKSEDLLFE